MLDAIVIIIVPFALALGALVYLYIRYIGTPAGQWKLRLRRHISDLQYKLAAYNDAIAAAAPKITALSHQLYERQLRALTPDALSDYAGIGPGTVERLRNAGLRSVPDIERYHLESIGGIGPVKSKEIQDAVKKVLADARSRFDAGASSEGQEFRRRLASSEMADERSKREAILRDSTATLAAIAACDDVTPYAQQVTFWRFLCGQGGAGLPEEIRNRPFPTPHPIVPPGPVAKPSSPVILPPVSPPPPPTLPPPPPADIFLGTPSKPTPTAPSVLPGIDKLRGLCRFGLAVAKADGRLAQAERKVIRGFAGAQFGQDDRLLRFLDPTLEQCEKTIPSVEEATEEVKQLWPQNEHAVLVRFAENVTDATGSVRSAKENEMLARLAKALGVESQATPTTHTQSSPPVLTKPASPAQPPTSMVESPRVVLEIGAGVELSPELIRRRYMLLTEKLDPARAATLGAEFAAMADRKRTAIRAAAETLIAQFGVSLELPAAPPPPSDIRHNPDLDDVFGR